MPMTPRILKMFEPVMFPIAMSALPFLIAIIETASSGREVPMATADTAMMPVDMLNMLAIVMTESIVKLAEK